MDLQRHTKAVRGVASSADGELLATGGEDGLVCLWTPRHQTQPLRVYQHGTAAVDDVALSIDLLLLASAGRDRCVRLYDNQQGRELLVLRHHAHQVNCVVFSADSQLVFSGGKDNVILVQSVESGALLRTLAGHTDWVRSIAVSQNGKCTLSASNDGTVRVWRADEVLVLRGHDDHVNWLCLSPAESTVLTASRDHTLGLWRLDSQCIEHRLRGHSSSVLCCDFSGDGLTCVSSSRDDTVRLWKVQDGSALSVLCQGVRCLRLLWVPEGSNLLLGLQSGVLRIVDSLVEVQPSLLSVGSDAISAQESSSSTTADGKHKVVVHKKKPLKKFVASRHAGWVRCLALSADGRVAISGGDDNMVRIWKDGAEVHVHTNHSNHVYGVAMSKDGTLAASAAWDCLVCVYDTTEYMCLLQLQGHAEHALCCALSPTAHLLASGGADSKVVLWNIETGEQLRVLFGHRSWVRCCTISDDGNWLVSTSQDWTSRVWSLPSGTLQAVLEGHSAPVMCAAIAFNNSFVLTAGDDGTLRTFSLAGEPIRVLQGHREAVSACAISPEARHLLSSSWDKTLRIWDAEQCTTLEVLHGHKREVLCCAWAGLPFSEESTIVSGSCDHTIVFRTTLAEYDEVDRDEDGKLRSAPASPCEQGLRLRSSSSDSDDSNLMVVEASQTAAAAAATAAVAVEVVEETPATPLPYFEINETSSPESPVLSLDDVSPGSPGTIHAPKSPPPSPPAKTSNSPPVRLQHASAPAPAPAKSQSVQSPVRALAAVSADPPSSASQSLPQQSLSSDVAAADTASLVTGPSALSGAASEAAGQTPGEAKDKESGNDQIRKIIETSGRKRREIDHSERTLKHPGAVHSVALNCSGSLVCTGCADGLVRLWDGHTGVLLRECVGHTQAVQCVDMLSSAEWAHTNSRKRKNSSEDAEANAPRAGAAAAAAATATATTAAAEDGGDDWRGDVFVSVSLDRTARIWSTRRPTVVHTLQHTHELQCCAVSRDGQLLLAGGKSRLVLLFAVESGQLQLSLEGHTRPISACAFAPGTSLLATAAHDTVVVWNRQGQRLHTLEQHPREVSGLAFSPDGGWIATSSGCTLQVWQAPTAARKLTDTGHRTVTAACYSPCGKFLLCGSRAKYSTVFSLEPGNVQVMKSFRGHSDCVQAVAWSADGQWLATGSADNAVKMYARPQKLEKMSIAARPSAAGSSPRSSVSSPPKRMSKSHAPEASSRAGMEPSQPSRRTEESSLFERYRQQLELEGEQLLRRDKEHRQALREMEAANKISATTLVERLAQQQEALDQALSEHRAALLKAMQLCLEARHAAEKGHQERIGRIEQYLANPQLAPSRRRAFEQKLDELILSDPKVD
eukprot:m.256669 g.256669  ORF g.256669 m.256669 type:complete len:1358 (-) comp22700_c0_seq7:38-4111(-)